MVGIRSFVLLLSFLLIGVSGFAARKGTAKQDILIKQIEQASNVTQRKELIARLILLNQQDLKKRFGDLDKTERTELRIRHRELVHRLLGTSAEFYSQRYANAIDLANLYFERNRNQPAIRHLNQVLETTPEERIVERNILLQYLSKFYARNHNYQEAEHYFAKFALGVRYSIDYAQAAENYDILILYGEKANSGNIAKYYASWYHLASSFDADDEKIRVLKKWINYGIRYRSPHVKTPVDRLAEIYLSQQMWPELSQLYLQYASSIQNPEAANDVYWEYFQAMEKHDQVPDLDILTRLYNFLKANGRLEAEQTVLTAIYLHQDYTAKTRALSRLANLAILNEDWNNAYRYHKQLLEQAYVMQSPEGPVILENLIRVAQRLSRDEDYIRLLSSKVFSSSNFVLQLDRFNAFQELAGYYVKRKRYEEGFDLFKRYLDSGIATKRLLYQTFIWGAEIKEKTGNFDHAFQLYRQAYTNAPGALNPANDRKATIARKMLLIAKTQLGTEAQLVAYNLLKTRYLAADSDALPDTLWNMGRLYEQEKKIKAAIVAYREALEASRTYRKTGIESRVLARLNKLETGSIDEKRNRLLELKVSQEKTGATESLIFTNLEIGNLQLQAGNVDEAFTSYQTAASKRSAERLQVQLDQLLKGASNLHNIEQYALSSQLVQVMTPLISDGDVDHRVRLLTITAGNALAQQRYQTALQAVDTALNLPSTVERTSNFILKSEILLRLNQFTQAETLLLNLDQKKVAVQLNLGRAYFGLKNYPQTIMAFKKLEALEQEERSNIDLAVGYSLLSQALFFQQNLRDAISAQQRLLAYLKQKQDTERLGPAYLNLTRYQLASGKINDAKDSIYQAGLVMKEPSETIVKLKYYQAQIAQNLGRIDDAIEHYNQVIERSTTIRDQYFLGSTYYGRGTAYHRKLLLPQAQQDLRRSIRFFLNAGEDKSILQSRLALASVSILGADYKTAAGILDQLRADPKNRESMGEVLLGLASLKADLTEYGEALLLTDQALDIFQERQNNAQLMEATNLKASIFLKMNDFNSAEVTYNKALEYNQTLNNELFTATVANNLGALYQQTGKYDLALNSYLKAGQIQGDLGFEAELALTMNNIATSYMSLNDYDKALEYLAKSRQIAEKYDLKRDISLTFANEGIAFFQLGKLEEAKVSLKKSLALQKTLGLTIDQAKTLNNIAFIEKEQYQLERAVNTIQQALKLLAEDMRGDSATLPNPDLNNLTSPNLVKNLLLNKGFWLRELAISHFEKRAFYLKAAADSLSKSIALLEIIRHQLKGGQSQELLVAENIDVFEQLITIQYEIGELEKKDKYYARAFPIGEQSKARSFLDKFQEQIAFSNITLPRSYRDRENLVKSQLVTVNATLFSEINKSESEKDQKKIKRLNLKKTELDLAFKNLKQELEEKYPNYANVKYPKIYDLKLLREKIIGRTSAVVSYFLGSEASYGWYISQKTLKMVKLPGKNNLKKLIEKYRITLKDPLSFYDDDEDTEVDNRRLHLAIGLKLHEILIKPFEIEPEIKSILLLADGALHYLPFETLVTRIDVGRSQSQAARQHYLIEDYSIYYAPSASVLGAAMDNLKARGHDPKHTNLFLGFGDPEFSPEQADHDVKIDPVFQAKGFYNLARLHATSTEVNKISSLFAGSNRTFYQQAALEEKAKELSEQSKYIHFATHGILDEDNPEFSGVVLNLIRDQKEDGFLKSSEIWDMRLNADLVTLSACETGLGKIVSGEGMVGLTRSFLYAGSASVVVSLWTVADDSTSELMINFYKYLKKGFPKIEALRQAKLEFVNKQKAAGDFQDPFYWGPFVLNGMQQ